VKYKDVKIQLKEIGDEGTFSGYAAVFNNTDLGGDIIAPGAFTKSIKENPRVPVLWGHDTREVIGINKEVREDSVGLHVSGQLILDVQRAKEARFLVKEGAVKGLSIGYDALVVDYSKSSDGIRILKEVKLWEYSLVPFPMNPEATISGVKSLDEFESRLCEVIDYVEEHSDEIPSKKNGLIDQAIKQLSILRGVGKTAEPAETDIQTAAAKCDEILKQFKSLQ
jgi:HK97 family phage prohead protease